MSSMRAMTSASPSSRVPETARSSPAPISASSRRSANHGTPSTTSGGPGRSRAGWSACDFRYADPNLRFGIPIARTLGNCLSLKGYSRLVDYVGPAKAKELIMLAKLLTADEALSLGVVTEIVPADELETRVGEVAERLTTLAPLTLAATKESIRRIQAGRTPDSAEGEDIILSCYMSDDFKGAVEAFVEKRKYTWTGR
jgi:enoyl-CoA hydratase